MITAYHYDDYDYDNDDYYYIFSTSGSKDLEG